MGIKIRNFFFPFLLLMTPLSAEILSVEVRFNPAFCNLQCPSMLTTAFQNMQAVAEVSMNGQQGQAILRYKPNQPFDYRTLRNAIASVGTTPQYLRVKVRGAIRGQNNNFAISSMGDNTLFYLLGPIQASPTQYTISASLSNHPLPPYLIETLQKGVAENRIAVVQGWLFQPDRSPPYYIVIEQMNYVVEQQ